MILFFNKKDKNNYKKTRVSKNRKNVKKGPKSLPQKAPNPPALTPIRPKLPKSSGQIFAQCGHAKFALLLFDPAAGYFKPSLCIGHPGYIPWPWDTHIGRTCAPAALEHRQCCMGGNCLSEVGRFGCAFFAQAAHSFSLAHALAGQRPRGYQFPLHCTAVCSQ